MDRESKGIAKGNGQRIIVGMSGGVDSSIALILLKKNGWDPIGVSLKYCVWQDKSNKQKENICCSTESILTAKKICKKYGCKHVTLDISKQFQDTVINYFVETLKKSQTPNPCMICNRETKFKELINYANSQGIKYVSTGHYAKITKSKKYSSRFISLPKDKKKDQTYYLSLLPQEYLERIMFPLGDLTKEEVYKIAEKEDLDFYLKLAQSQDFCFVSEDSMNNFLEKEVGGKKGNIVDTKGKILGTHIGLQHYTIGQRKGIGLSGGPYFVVLKDAKKNVLVVSKKLSDLQTKEVKLTNVYFSNDKLYKKKLDVNVKIRYQAKTSKATLIYKKDRSYNLLFKSPQTSVTPGQFAVFYLESLCIGSGVIK
ncbi:MAG: tRNA 2-thiouridine(34) synthase MnmA [Patescibacteria group bacterium]